MGDRKVAIVFREVPGEPHMCLAIFTETLGNNIHDPIMKCIESDVGQTSQDLADALNRSYTKDGQVILQKLHAEGMIKKIQTEQIVMTPLPNTRIKLSELNKVLDEMEKGEQAVKRLAEMDAQAGIQDVAQVARQMRGNTTKDAWVEPSTILAAPENTALDDNVIAAGLRSQAARLSAEANGLLAEADRLSKEAAALEPAPAIVVNKARSTPRRKVVKVPAPQ